MGNKAHSGRNHPQIQQQLHHRAHNSLATEALATSVDFLKVPGGVSKHSDLNLNPEHLPMAFLGWGKHETSILGFLVPWVPLWFTTAFPEPNFVDGI